MVAPSPAIDLQVSSLEAQVVSGEGTPVMSNQGDRERESEGGRERVAGAQAMSGAWSADGVPAVDSGDKERVVEAFRAAIGGAAPPSEVALEALRGALQLSGSDWRLTAEQNQQLENGLRSLLFECVEASAAAGVPVLQYKLPAGSRDAGGMEETEGNRIARMEEGAGTEKPGLVIRLLDIVLFLGYSGHMEGGVVLQLLEDLIEESVISDCKEVFGWIEAKQSVLSKDVILQRGKLILLRACNQLVRRLSKANDLVFCGRILMLLAFLFPIAEKSAVNFKGAFNTANKTAYQHTATDALPPSFDFNFYSTFWSLQEYFCNPPSAAVTWPSFSAGLKTVLSTFSAQPLAESAAAEATAVVGDLGSFNVKYLTSPNLLTLELKDHNFRRHVLLQCVFLLDFLTLPAVTATGRQDKGKEKEREERRSAMLVEVGELQQRVRKLLRSIPPRGKEFLEAVDRVMAREQNWVQWKKDGCPAFDRPMAVLSSFASAALQEKEKGAKGGVRGTMVVGQKGQKMARKAASAHSRRPFMGNRELGELFLWADQHPDILTDPEAAQVPRLREFLQPLADDMDPASGVEEDIHRKNDRVYSWRALRLAARQDIDAFNRFDPVHGMELVVPPDMLVEEVRYKLHKRPQPAPSAAAAAPRHKKEAVPAPSAAASTPQSGPGEATPMEGANKAEISRSVPGDKETPTDAPGEQIGQLDKKGDAMEIHASGKKRTRSGDE